MGVFSMNNKEKTRINRLLAMKDFYYENESYVSEV